MGTYPVDVKIKRITTAGSSQTIFAGAARCLTSGKSNFIGGYNAGRCITEGEYNILLGVCAGANATWSTISASPEMTGIASGSLDSGKPVALTQDGKLMPITGVSGLLGTAADIPDTANGGGCLVYDSTNDKYVFFYGAANGHDDYIGALIQTTIKF